jgi:regulator of nucleoside diphosphate kinase
MPNESCILNTRDFVILEAIRSRFRAQGNPLLPMVTRKIAAAVVIRASDVPANVATLNSRVTFRVAERKPDTRVIVLADKEVLPIGTFLLLTRQWGLALLGLTEGQRVKLTDAAGYEESIILEKVHYQPEAGSRARQAACVSNLRLRPNPLLRLIRGGLYDRPRLALIGTDQTDKPGPSAA